jgi:predicted RNA binding protein YcfA (HicA-like mRNA interferase family)
MKSLLAKSDIADIIEGAEAGERLTFDDGVRLYESNDIPAIGWAANLVRRRGSHIAMQKRTEDSTITVPVPDQDELRAGTLQSIIRQSGLPRDLFETK